MPNRKLVSHNLKNPHQWFLLISFNVRDSILIPKLFKVHTLLPKQLEVSKGSFWYPENSDFSRLLKITPSPSFKLLLCRLLSHLASDPSKRGLLAAFPESSDILWSKGLELSFFFSCQAGSRQQEHKALPFSPTSPAFNHGWLPSDSFKATLH